MQFLFLFLYFAQLLFRRTSSPTWPQATTRTGGTRMVSGHLHGSGSTFLISWFPSRCISLPSLFPGNVMMKWFVVMLWVIRDFRSKCLTCRLSYVKLAGLTFQNFDPSTSLKTILWYLVYLVQIRHDMMRTSSYRQDVVKSIFPVLQYLPRWSSGHLVQWQPHRLWTCVNMIGNCQ